MIYCNYKFSIYYRRLWKLLFLVTWMIFIHSILNLTHEIKKNSNPNHYYPKYGGWKVGQGNASICTLVRTLAPPPIRICICQEKAVRDLSNFVFEGCFHLQYLREYLPMNKRTLKVKYFPLRYGGSKIQEYFPNVLVCISICQKNCKNFLQFFFFAVHS